MRILVTNDDGIHSVGLKALADRLFGTPQLRRLAPRLLAAAWAIGAVLNFVLVVVPAYA